MCWKIFCEDVDPDMIIGACRNHGAGEADPQHQRSQQRVYPDDTFTEQVSCDYLVDREDDHAGQYGYEKAILKRINYFYKFTICDTHGTDMMA